LAQETSVIALLFTRCQHHNEDGNFCTVGGGLYSLSAFQYQKMSTLQQNHRNHKCLYKQQWASHCSGHVPGDIVKMNRYHRQKTIAVCWQNMLTV